ncbi:MAG: elongation factor G [Ignavibacteriales bacterium]|nr:elongation factor G [Ignavibacteriales bacterium]
MKEYTTEQIRNVILVGHGGAGKTSLSEALLFTAGASTRIGKIDEGSTHSDYRSDEIERKISITTSLLHCEWRNVKINFLDTPGYTDFTGEVKGAMRVADTAILLLKAFEGVEVGTEIAWGYAREYNVPTIFLINKVDGEHVDLPKVLKMVHDRFGGDAAVVEMPLATGPNFTSVIDIPKMKTFVYQGDKGKYTESEIPADHLNEAEHWRQELLEKVAESDEKLLEKFFENGTLTDDEFRAGFQNAFRERKIFPIISCSATKNIGTGSLLDFLVDITPNPAQRGHIKAHLTGTEKEVSIPTEANAEPVGFVFKTVSEPHVGELSFFKVYSGKFTHGSDLINQSRSKSERLSQVFVINGKDRKEVGHLFAGDIGAVVKLKDTHTNNTLSSKAFSVVLPPIKFPDPVISQAIIAKTKGDEDKIGNALHRLHEEDPAFVVTHDPELNQTLVSGQGELHITIMVKRMKERYGVDVDIKEPRLPFRERIRGTSRVSYRHKKQSGGAGQFGEVYFHMEQYREGAPYPNDLSIRGKELEDLPWGGKLEFVTAIVGGAIDAKFVPAVKKGIMDIMTSGVIAGYPVADVRVILHDGKMHPVDSNENAFKTAGRMAFKEGFLQAKPVLFEPIYEIEVAVPEENMGDVMGDISGRRGKILGMDSNGSYQIVKAQVPLKELYRYSTTVRSMTQGRGIHKQKFSHYEEMPRETMEKVIAEAKHKVEEE